MKCIKRENKKEDVTCFDEIDFNNQYILLESKADKDYLLTVDFNKEILDISTGWCCGIFSEDCLNHYNVYVFNIKTEYLKKLRELLNKLEL